MALNVGEAKTWPMGRLKFEIGTRRQDIKNIQKELSGIRECEEDPDSCGTGRHPYALDFMPRDINNLQAEIRELREVIRSKV